MQVLRVPTITNAQLARLMELPPGDNGQPMTGVARLRQIADELSAKQRQAEAQVLMQRYVRFVKLPSLQAFRAFIARHCKFVWSGGWAVGCYQWYVSGAALLVH